MAVMNRFPSGGVPGGGGSGAVGLNVFTQMEEPAIKDGIWVKTNIPHKHVKKVTIGHDGMDSAIAWDLPYGFVDGCAVWYNNEIHILGGAIAGTSKNHYSWNGVRWKKYDDLPYDFYQGCAAIYNNAIHILGGGNASSSTLKNHYAWNARTKQWVKKKTLPYSLYGGHAVTYDNKLHILGGASTETETNNKKHYAYDGSAWSKVSTLPYSFSSGAAVVYKSKLRILGGSNGTGTEHYYWNGTEWKKRDDLPYNFQYGCAIGGPRYIHLLGGKGGTCQFRYHYDGTEWTKMADLPCEFNNGSAVLDNENCIHILGGTSSTTGHYQHDGDGVTDSWFSRVPYGKAITCKDEVHIMQSKNHWSWNGIRVKKYDDIPFEVRNDTDLTVLNDKIYARSAYDWDSWSAHLSCWGEAGWSDFRYPDQMNYDCAVIAYKDGVYVFGVDMGGLYAKHNGNTWEPVTSCPIRRGANAVVLKGLMHIFDGTNHYTFDGTTFTLMKTTLASNEIAAWTYKDEAYTLCNDGKIYKWIEKDDSFIEVNYPKNLIGKSGEKIVRGTATTYKIMNIDALVYQNGSVISVYFPAEISDTTVEPNTVGIDCSSYKSGSHHTCFADYSKAIEGDDQRFESFFDNVLYSGDTTELDTTNTYEYYVGNGTDWVKIEQKIFE